MKTTIPEKERIYHFFDSGRFTSSDNYDDYTQKGFSDK